MPRLSRQSTLFAATRDVEEHGGVTLRPHHRNDEHYTGSSSSSSSSSSTASSKKKPRSTRKRKATPKKSAVKAKKVKHWSSTLEDAQISALDAINVDVADLASIEAKPAPLWSASEVAEWAEAVAGESLKNIPPIADDVDGASFVALGSAGVAASTLFPAKSVSKSVQKRVWGRLEALREATPAALKPLYEEDAAAAPKPQPNKKKKTPAKTKQSSSKKKKKTKKTKKAAMPAAASGATFAPADPATTAKAYSIPSTAYFAVCLIVDVLLIALLIQITFGVRECASGRTLSWTCLENGVGKGQDFLFNFPSKLMGSLGLAAEDAVAAVAAVAGSGGDGGGAGNPSNLPGSAEVIQG